MPSRVSILVVLLLTAAVYAQVVRHDFIDYDDPGYITANQQVRTGLGAANLHWAFTTFDEYSWHPVTWLSLQLDSTLFGLEPGPRHAMNVALHLAATALLYLFLVRTTRARGPSLLVAALFALHPLNVQPVAWLAQRKDVLSAVWFGLGLLAYAHYAERPGAGRYTAVVAVCALGLMTKAVFVTFPFLLLLIDFWPLRRWPPVEGEAARGPGHQDAPGRLVAEKLPLLALAVATSLAELAGQQSGGSVVALGLAERLANAALSYAAYLGAVVWPVDLAIHYPWREDLLDDGASRLRVAGAALLLAVVTAAALALARRHRPVVVGWLWFLGVMVPMAGIVQVGLASMADRYAYLTAIGLFVAVVFGAHELARTRRARRRAAAVGVAAVALLAWRTTAELGHWRSSETVFTRALEVTSDNAVAHIQLARVHSDAGEPERAIEHLLTATRLAPERWKAHNNLGNALQAAGRVAESVAPYRRALVLRPDSAAAHYNFGRALQGLGRPAEAATHFRRALALDPAFDAAHLDLAHALVMRAPAAALPHYRRAVTVQPRSFLAHYGLAHALSATGSEAEAVESYRHALALQPGDAVVLNDLGVTLFSLGRTAESVRALRRAVDGAPGTVDFRFNLARALAAEGDTGAAIRELESVLAARPGDAGARELLAQLGADGRPLR